MIISLLNRIIDSIEDGIIAIDRFGIVTHYNETAALITGVSSDVVIGRPVSEALPDSPLPVVLKSGEPDIGRTMTLPNNRHITFKRLPVVDGTGETVGAVSLFRDITQITDLVAQNSALKEIQSLLEAIIDASQNAISVVDEQGIGLIINSAYSQLTGLAETDVIGKPADIDIAEGDSVHMQVLNTRKPIKGSRLKIKPHNRDVLVNAAPIMVDRALKGSVAVIHDISELKMLSEELISARQLIRSLASKYSFNDVIGSSEELQTAVQLAKKAAEVPATVLLRGESGTGKELFAHAIHDSSDRKSGQFVRVNCATIVESLFESELFGHEEGAFTGSKKGGKKGLFEEADSGTLFFDEIFELSLGTQAKLLRVLQEKEITRVGGTVTIPVDVRIIAATHVNLEEAVQTNRFRQDLYYRLNVMPIIIPALRHRRGDIKDLTFYIVKKLNQEFGRNITAIHPKALRILESCPWYGNVRELENILAQSMTKMGYTETEIRPANLPELDRTPNYQQRTSRKTHKRLSTENQATVDLKTVLDQVEKDYILKVLAESKWRKTEAARRLGISIRNLYNKIDKHRIEGT